MPEKLSKDPALTVRLQKASAELKEVGEAIKTGMTDARMLVEFRQAINHVRHTAWAVEKWAQEEKAGGDPYSVISMVTAERIRVATQLLQELSSDIEAGDIDFETKGTAELLRCAKTLVEQLQKFVRPG